MGDRRMVLESAVEGRVPPEVLILAERLEGLRGLKEDLARLGYSVSVGYWVPGSPVAEAGEPAVRLVLALVGDLGEVSQADIVRLAGGVPGRRRVALVGHGGVAERVRMLNAGADMCLPGGLSQAELVARVTALLRRADIPPDHVALREGQLTLDLARRSAAYRGRRLSLSSYEYRVLRDLALQVMECRSRFSAAGDDRLSGALRRLSDYAEDLEQSSRISMRQASAPLGETMEARKD